VSTDLAGAIKGLGTDLRAAVAEGREAIREREAELHSEVERRQGAGAADPFGR
jgi:hypothetical protein